MRINLKTFKEFVYYDNECASSYFDRKTGEILLSKDMLFEEIENNKRFLKIPFNDFYSIHKEAVELWVTKICNIAAENYDNNFALHIQSQLNKAIHKVDYVESVNTVLVDLQSQGLDDNYFTDWLEFIGREEENNIKSWLASNGINLLEVA